jgi:aminopeptidase N
VRGKVGASYFDAAMQDYYNAELYKVTTPDAFFDALARHTSVDISPLVKSYFASTVALPCSISNDAAGCRH